MPTLLSVHKQELLSYSVDQGITRQATDYYLVIFDSAASPIAAEVAAGIPVYGDSHPDDSTRSFKQKRASCVDNSDRTHWTVQVDYDSAYSLFPNPLSKPREITWDYGEGTETYFLDHTSLYGGTSDKAVTTSAGETFEKLPERDRGEWTATFVKNVASTFSIAPEINAMQVVNSASFTFDGNTIAAYAAKISGGGLSAVQTENGTQFRVLTYKLKFKSGGWLDKFEDRGFNESNGTGGLKPIVKGTPPTQTDKPWPLDGSGAKKPNSTDKGAELDFYPYTNMSFSGFGFS
jgi:hypothetical protein